MTSSDSLSLETAHTIWGVERYNQLANLANLMFNEWTANPEREADTWYGEADFDINLYDDDDGKLKAVLYYVEQDSTERHYNKFITIVEQTYPPLGFTQERFDHIKAYASTEFADFMSGDRERTYRGETWDDDYELCFDVDEDDRDAVTIELYKRVNGEIQWDEVYNFTVKELTTTNE